MEPGLVGAVARLHRGAGRSMEHPPRRRRREGPRRGGQAGGLFVIGSGRHDSRRVDDQLRGRPAGRDVPRAALSSSSAWRSDLITRHAGDILPASATRWTEVDGVVHEAAAGCAVEHAQRVAEGVNHEIHRNTWRYSVVIEQQRIALAERRGAAAGEQVGHDGACCDGSRTRPRRSTRTCCPTRRARSRSTTWTWALGQAPGRAVRGARGPCNCGRSAGTRWTSSRAGRSGVAEALPGDRDAHDPDVRGR